MYAVEMQHITKRFGHFTANHQVDFQVHEGEIHALIGENGAGKSTLMRILYGFYTPDAGQIYINGREVKIQKPSDAITLGVGMVHQHFMLIPPLTVTENIILGKEETNRLGILNLPLAAKQLTELSQTYRLHIDPSAKIEQVSIGFQQRIEILKILYRNAQIIILDEPTPILTPQEIDDLFKVLLQLKSEGKTIILITHKLSEVMTISNRITIMRHGKIVGTRETKSTTQTELARLMIGEEIGPPISKRPFIAHKDILIMEQVSAKGDRGVLAVRNVSLNVKEGEIIGIAGVEGNGQSELVQVIAGLRPFQVGEISIGSHSLSPTHGHQALAHIPEDRLRFGLILDFTLQENLILGRQQELRFRHYYFLQDSETRSYSSELIHSFDIRPEELSLPARNFSGGNQQKIVVARELSKNVPLIVASQPTRGLDIRAIDFIHNSLISERNKGKAILLVSSDLGEILKLSDRIAVMYEGEITKVFLTADTDEREIGMYMTGAKKKSA
ncbi:MAG: ABC transporter ATP-binding protein [Ignavibacteriae bacterium]|nr:ABC transporter ATP-binding protein [Ignavibacteria bacterium]MBI3363674.1 ABC transporter ATP-binding protein [Ignavibacteriota bacterium]